MIQKTCLLCFLVLISACRNSVNTNKSTLVSVLKSKHPIIEEVLKNKNKYKPQIQFSRIEREHNGIVTFKTEQFQVQDSSYFYPASTVKFPIALLALERIKASTFNSNTPFFIEGDSTITSIRKEVSKLFVLSDNDAYNRLYEYLGSDYINNTLKKKGIKPILINHRLATKNAHNRDTKALIFIDKDSVLFHAPGTLNSSEKILGLKNTRLGKGYISENEFIAEAKDFSKKNYFPITTQHELLKRLFFPNNYAAEEIFDLTKEDLNFLQNMMRALPRDAGYDQEKYHDSYVKFFMFGAGKTPIPDHIKIYNKIGLAYGFVTDNAYIIDTKNNIEFLLTASIYVNKNNIFNDDVYEYDTIGIPFLEQLGKEIYAAELKYKEQ